MRRRLVFSIIGVVLVVLGMLVLPVVYVVGATTADENVRSSLYLRLGILALIAIGATAILALIQARQLAQPLERLARRADRIGDGDFSGGGKLTTGIREIDAIDGALHSSAERVNRMLEAERNFTADATHQLRTGLTGIAMRLELLERHPDPDIAADAGAALSQTHELNTTLDELLTVARQGSTVERRPINLVELTAPHVAEWEQRYTAKRREIVFTEGTVELVHATPGLVGQVLDIFLDNALRHGRGTVSVHVDHRTVTVRDRGPGVPAERLETLFDRPQDPAAPHGRGLSLARRLAEADGGSVELAAVRPATFQLTLPPHDEQEHGHETAPTSRPRNPR